MSHRRLKRRGRHALDVAERVPATTDVTAMVVATPSAARRCGSDVLGDGPARRQGCSGGPRDGGRVTSRGNWLKDRMQKLDTDEADQVPGVSFMFCELRVASIFAPTSPSFTCMRARK